MIITFTNPANGYTENYNTSTAPIWCLLFGVFYWLVRGNIAHAIISFILAVCTIGISWLIYPFFTNQINIRAYGKKGWINNNYVKASPVHTIPVYSTQSSEKIIYRTTPQFGTFGWTAGFYRNHWKVMIVVSIIGGIICGVILIEKTEGKNSSLLYDMVIENK